MKPRKIQLQNIDKKSNGKYMGRPDTTPCEGCAAYENAFNRQ